MAEPGYAPRSAAEMVEVILKDKKKILPCSLFLQLNTGLRSVRRRAGQARRPRRGAGHRIKLTADEQAALDRSSSAVRELVDVIKV